MTTDTKYNQIPVLPGKRQDATSRRAVGGHAFPGDFNWTCPVCDRENRAFEESCPYCEWDIAHT